MPLDKLFGIVAAVTLLSGVLMFLLVRPVRRLMGGVL